MINLENCMFWFQNLLFEMISGSFGIIFGQKTHEHVEAMKKRCLEAKNDIFRKNAFKGRYVFLEGFPRGLPWRDSLPRFLRKVLID